MKDRVKLRCHIATEVDSKKRNYEMIIDEHLQEETKTRRSHLVEEQFADTGNSSEIEIERAMCTAINRARDMQKKCKTANSGYSGQIMSRNRYRDAKRQSNETGTQNK